MAGPLAISIGNVSKTFGGHLALDNVSFALKRGEVHCIAGENGCGKSTLIKIINGVYQPDQGAQIVLPDGVVRASVTPKDARRLGIHVIWQDLALFPHLTVAENICFDQFVDSPFLQPSRKSTEARAQEVLDKLGLTLHAGDLVSSLAIADRQLVAICRVLCAGPRIMFMDEPTASLTKHETDRLLSIVKQLTSEGLTVVFVSHRLAEVLSVSDRVTVLRDGKLVGTYAAKDMTQKQLSFLMTGQQIDAGTPPAPRDGPCVLEVTALSRSGEYENVTFNLKKGQVLGLIGLLGSGRTELALTLFGMTRPDSGQIVLNGQKAAFANNRDAIRAGIAYVSEDRLNLGLVQPQAVRDNMALPVMQALTKGGFFLAPSRIMRLAKDWIARLSIKVHDPALPVSSLSGGNQQRVAIAKWLATEPSVLILDSPTVGVDIGAKAGIYALVRQLAEQGMAIILISDEASEIHANCDQALIMRNGRIVATRAMASTTEQQLEEALHA